MAKRKPPPSEIKLVAFTSDADGILSVYDIVTTSLHFASYFARRWYRDANICEMAAMPPNTSLGDCRYFSRTIFRGHA